METTTLTKAVAIIMSILSVFTGCKNNVQIDYGFVPEVSSLVTADTPINASMQAMLDDGGSFPSYEAESSTAVVDLAAAGLVPDSPEAAASNTKIISSAIKKAKDGTTILLPSGRYCITASMLNHIAIDGKNGIYIKGDSTELVNTSFDASPDGNSGYVGSVIMYITDSVGVTLDGISVDFLHHTTAEGMITEQKDGKTYFRLPEDFDKGGVLPLIGGEHCLAASFFEPDGIIRSEERYFSDEENMTINKESDSTFSVNCICGSVGKRILLRLESKEGAAPLFPAMGNTNLTFRNINIYSSPSAVVIATSGNVNLCFDGMKVEAREGLDRLYASNVDCIHIADMRGKLVLKNSRFVGIGDDALNIHSMTSRVDSISGNNVKILNRDGSAPGSSWAKAGDTVEFFDEKLSSIGRSKILGFDGSKLVLDTLPELPERCTFVHNISSAPVTYIENCHVERSRARAFLIQTKNTVIKDCSFENIRLSALLVSPDFVTWFEGGFVDNLLITGNTFNKCCIIGRDPGFGVITASNCHDSPTGAALAQKSHINISVIDNEFRNCPAKNTVLLCTQNPIVQ